MNAHKNARTTPHNRALIVQRVLREGRTAKSVAADFGVSERTVYKWLARHRGFCTLELGCHHMVFAPGETQILALG